MQAMRTSGAMDGMEVLKEGYLTKQGHVRKNWKRRWFVLTKSQMSYHEQPGAPAKGRIPLDNVTISLEGANRHLLDHEAALEGAPYFVRENSQETAFRYTQSFFNEKLEITGLAIVFGWKAQDGAVVRVSADYELRDALVLSGGILIFHAGELPPIDSWGRNDRLIFSLKWSF